MNFIGKTTEERTFDAIVIGSGMSGGYAAKELCDRGVKTLVLERGRPLKHGDYPTATLDPWEIDNAGRLSREMLQRNPIIARCYAYDKTTEHLFVKDEEQPYIQEKPFDWIRSYQEGGKSLVWARGCQRWSKYDFEAPGRDGYGIEWPITYDDLAPWYSDVERFVGWSGNKDGLEHFPDGEFLPPYEFNCVEKHMKEKVESTFKDRFFIQGRCAHLTEVKEIHRQQGRGLCLSRTLCQRGCPYGAYFSSNSSTLPWAERTGNLTIRTHSVVHSIIYDEDLGKATGVRVVDANTLEMTEFYARIVFVNAACINSNMILLNSTSDRFPNGLGNDSGVLGHYIGFHNYRGRMSATIDGFDDSYFYGRRPTGPIIPPFRNVFGQESDADFQGRYHISMNASRPGWNRGVRSDKIGKELIEELQTPGSWRIGGRMSGEVVPKFENHVRLSETETDKWGFPQLVISIDYAENDVKMMHDFLEKGAEILEAVGGKNITVSDNNQAPGLDIHEMGGVRMGKDPKTSILNKWNQVHSCKNVFVTDGACMTTVSTQNPSLTFMALTARAANYAVEQIRKGDL